MSPQTNPKVNPQVSPQVDRATFTAKAYLKVGCPFSFRYLLFMSEAGLLEQVEIVRCDPRHADFERVKGQLQQATGAEAVFPTVEVEPGVFKSDSGELIELYARKNDLAHCSSVVLSFYEEGLFPELLKLHEEHEALAARAGR